MSLKLIFERVKNKNSLILHQHSTSAVGCLIISVAFLYLSILYYPELDKVVKYKYHSCNDKYFKYLKILQRKYKEKANNMLKGLFSEFVNRKIDVM